MQTKQSYLLKSVIQLFSRNVRCKSSNVPGGYSYDVLKQEYAPGAVFEGFQVFELTEIPEFHLVAAKLKHQFTKSEYLHLFRNDNNNCFSVGFRTTPSDSTGLTHILEHTTLCGSLKYPCRDPFFKMLNRSLATFMNALTGPDYTMYPFATQNPHDFINLMSVYLDAVFNPRLREIDFKQEGWRLEFQDIDNANSPIVFKGVVFNEMKGSFSDPQSVFGQALLNNLLPSHTYGHISGGDPKQIPLLTPDDVKDFHQKYYHPSNAKFFSYGNFPLIDHLTFINKNYLVGRRVTGEGSFVNVVPLETRWTAPRKKHITCRMDPLAANPKKQSTIAVSVLLHDICDLKSGFDWSVISELLVSGPNSAFYRSLVEPQIGAGFAPCTGYESQTRDTFFAVGLQGVDPSDFDKIVATYDKTIDDVIRNGFDLDHIQAVLHGIELSIKNELSNFGLSLLFSVAPLWNHEGNIIEMLSVNKQLKEFRDRLKVNPHYLQEVLQKSLKGNMHRLILTMSPDGAYEQKLIEEEMRLLESKIKSLTDEDRMNILKQGYELLKEQRINKDVSCLPTLRLGEINKDITALNLQDSIIQGVPVQISEQQTNNLVYFRGVLNASSLNKHLKRLLPLFATSITKMGTETSSYRELDQMINLKTGGINFTPHLRENLVDLRTQEEGLLFSSHSLEHNLNEMFRILLEIITKPRFDDEKRFETITRMTATALANSLIDRGHQYAMLSAGSFVSSSVAFKESFAGVSFVDEMRRISQMEDLVPILEDLRSIASAVFSKNHLRTSVNYSTNSETNILQSIDSFFENIPGEVIEPFFFSPVEEVKYEHNAVHHVLPIPVNFAAKAIQTVAYTHEDFSGLTVLAKLLSAKYLHPLIREKGGAYGSGAMLSMSGTFLFYSYRDPNSFITFDVFDDAARWTTQGKFSDQDLEEAILGTFQKVDAPVPPGQKGMECFLYGICDSILQEHRLRLMAVTKQNVMDVASKYLSEDLVKGSGRALLGPINANVPTDRKNETWLVKIHD